MRREPRQIAEVEEHRPAGEAEFQTKGRVLEGPFDEPWLNEIAHDRPKLG